jgi:ribosomal protein S4
MTNKKKYRYKPVYKKFIVLKKNVQNKTKLFGFKKLKWQFLLSHLSKMSKFRKNNSYYTFYDQNIYLISKYSNFFSKNYKQSLLTKKSFNLFYGSLSKNFIKKNVLHARNESNRVQNKINSKIFLKNFLERRLDTILLRSHFTSSIMNARQLISHGHVFIDNKKNFNPATLVKKGDVITFSIKSHKLLEYFLLNSHIWPLPPKYMQISYKIFQIIIIDDIKTTNPADIFSMWLNLNEVMKSYKR